MTASLTFHQPHPGGRILLMMGQHQIGAVFPPPRGDHSPLSPWRHVLWLHRIGNGFAPEYYARTEQAAKNALLAEAKEWLRKAGVGA